jgi:hypothetical protein
LREVVVKEKAAVGGIIEDLIHPTSSVTSVNELKNPSIS